MKINLGELIKINILKYVLKYYSFIIKKLKFTNRFEANISSFPTQVSANGKCSQLVVYKSNINSEIK